MGNHQQQNQQLRQLDLLVPAKDAVGRQRLTLEIRKEVTNCSSFCSASASPARWRRRRRAMSKIALITCLASPMCTCGNPQQISSQTTRRVVAVNMVSRPEHRSSVGQT